MHLSNNRGTGIIERIVAGVPIRRASGTRDAEIFGKINDMLDEIDEAGRDDLARAIADKQILAVVLWNSYRRKGLSLRFTPEGALPLKAAVETWLTNAAAARRLDPDEGLDPKTCEDYGYALAALYAKKPKATAADLPELLRQRRRTARPRMFNLTRSASQAFLRENVTGGRYSELWTQASAVKVKKVRASRDGNPQPPERAREIAERLGIYGQQWWFLCCTGMGWKEYKVDGWDVLDIAYAIHGAKREDRDRLVPRFCTPVRPMCHERTFAAKLAAVARDMGIGHLTIYDARRTYRLFLEGAEIPKSWREAYMGHAAGDMDELYGEPGKDAITYYLPAHRDKLLAFVGDEPQWLRRMA